MAAEDVEDFCLLARYYAARTPQSFRKVWSLHNLIRWFIVIYFLGITKHQSFKTWHNESNLCSTHVNFNALWLLYNVWSQIIIHVCFDSNIMVNCSGLKLSMPTMSVKRYVYLCQLKNFYNRIKIRFVAFVTCMYLLYSTLKLTSHVSWPWRGLYTLITF